MSRLPRHGRRCKIQSGSVPNRHISPMHYRQDVSACLSVLSEQVYNEATYELEQLQIALEDAERELSYTEVRAPIAGTITGRLINLGDQVQIGQHLFDLVAVRVDRDARADPRAHRQLVESDRVADPLDDPIRHFAAGRWFRLISGDDRELVATKTSDEIARANAIDSAGLRHPEEDEARVQKAELLVVVGVCTHLGCVPLGQKTGEVKGEYEGWFCPCHGSHYDTSGRIRKGPAPTNLEVPPYTFLSDSVIRIG